MAQSNGIALLELTTRIERPQIAIDEVRYEILHPDELSVIEQARFGRAGRQIDRLAESDENGEDDKLNALIEETARKIAVGVPDDVWVKLNGAIQWAIIDLFTALSLRQKMTVAGAMSRAAGDLDGLFRPASQPTGGQSSPASSGSTASARKRGWKKFLSDWSGLI